MRFLSMIVCSSLLATASFASAELVEKAKNFGLVSFPKDPAQILQMAEDRAPDAKQYPLTNERVELGKVLYFDPRLSRSGIISCNTCHNLGYGGSDNIPASTGHKWSPNPHHLNSPTVFNSVFNSVQFWDGRAAHLAEQAGGPATSMVEMAATPEHIEAVVNSMPGYVDMFKKAYGDDVKITFDLVTASIGIFERTLNTPSRYDDFMNGDYKALSDEEKKGFDLFLEKGCATCHNDINLGGNMQTFALANKYKFADVGDFKGDENGMVKTPPLRNVKMTRPYFHNGAIWTVEEAIKEMGSVQLGIEISDEEAKSISIFFDALNGRMPEIVYPILPISTDKTPKPELDY